MDDLISRQAAIDAVLDRMNVEKHGRDAKPEEIQWTLEKLPSAQPEHTETHSCVDNRTETHGWIPVTERLPERGKEVLVTRDYDGRKDHNKSCRYVETASRYGEDDDVVWNSYSDEYKMTPKSNHVVAWMPLPPSYKEDENARN